MRAFLHLPAPVARGDHVLQGTLSHPPATVELAQSRGQGEEGALPERGCRVVLVVECETCPARQTERCTHCLVHAISARDQGPLLFDLAEVRALRLLAEKKLVGRVPPAMERPA